MMWVGTLNVLLISPNTRQITSRLLIDLIPTQPVPSYPSPTQYRLICKRAYCNHLSHVVRTNGRKARMRMCCQVGACIAFNSYSSMNGIIVSCNDSSYWILVFFPTIFLQSGFKISPFHRTTNTTGTIVLFSLCVSRITICYYDAHIFVSWFSGVYDVYILIKRMCSIIHFSSKWDAPLRRKLEIFISLLLNLDFHVR